MAQAVDEEMAKQIYQDLLDKICRAYFENDFCAFEEAMHVPHHFRTECVAQQIDTIDQLRHAFNCFREYFLGFGVTDFFRTCTGATPIGTDKIVGRHVTELLQNGTRLRPPYEVWGTLELIGDSWKVASSENALSDMSWQAHAVRKGAEKIHEPPQGGPTDNLPD